MSVDSRLKATKIIGQRKAFYRQRIPEFNRKHSIDTEFQSLVVRGKKLLTWASLKHLGMVTEKS